MADAAAEPSSSGNAAADYSGYRVEELMKMYYSAFDVCGR